MGVTMNKKACGFDKKIIVLGFDGLSPEIIEPMMKGNKLPNFSKLSQSGSYRHLLPANPSQSPVAWAAFATGENPGKNGVFDFIVRDPKTYQLRLALADIETARPKRVIRSQCFWQFASRKKIPAIIIACPVTFPPDKIYGRMFSGMGVPDILGTEGTFTFYTTQTLEENIGGKVFQIEKSPLMIMHLIGPRVAGVGQKTDNLKVPFKAVLQNNKESVMIEYQGHKFKLKTGQWSEWKKVTFKLGLFRKAKGIFKFYLVETEPEFKLYISPINFDPRNPLFPISYPNNYSRELSDKIGLYYTQGMPFHTWAVNEGRLNEEPFLVEANEVFKKEKAMLNLELKRFQKGILFAYFESPDIIQHMFWRYIDPQHPLYDAGAPKQYKECIENWYERMDRVLGEVMESLNEGDTLIVLSDHGFDSFRRTVHLNSWLRKNGFLQLKDPEARNGQELLKDIDWSKTKAYAISFGAIYINQLGREKYGIVKPGQETENLKEELIEKLKTWRDDKHNTGVVNKTYRREDIFWGEYAAQTPDLYVGFNRGYRASWQTALGAAPEELIEDNLKKWSGDHLFDPALIPGVIFSNRKITKQNPSIYDVTPTILKISDCAFEEDKIRQLDGETLFH
jgi:predicted AlkP superfamily phosphohydrolase/phosphomutase